ncbi:hypothetical protein JCM11641_005565 [Rhodosporidiobolus odoratus]
MGPYDSYPPPSFDPQHPWGYSLPPPPQQSYTPYPVPPNLPPAPPSTSTPSTSDQNPTPHPAPHHQNPAGSVWPTWDQPNLTGEPETQGPSDSSAASSAAGTFGLQLPPGLSDLHSQQSGHGAAGNGMTGGGGVEEGRRTSASGLPGQGGLGGANGAGGGASPSSIQVQQQQHHQHEDRKPKVEHDGSPIPAAAGIGMQPQLSNGSSAAQVQHDLYQRLLQQQQQQHARLPHFSHLPQQPYYPSSSLPPLAGSLAAATAAYGMPLASPYGSQQTGNLGGQGGENEGEVNESAANGGYQPQNPYIPLHPSGSPSAGSSAAVPGSSNTYPSYPTSLPPLGSYLPHPHQHPQHPQGIPVIPYEPAAGEAENPRKRGRSRSRKGDGSLADSETAGDTAAAGFVAPRPPPGSEPVSRAGSVESFSATTSGAVSANATASTSATLLDASGLPLGLTVAGGINIPEGLTSASASGSNLNSGQVSRSASHSRSASSAAGEGDGTPDPSLAFLNDPSTSAALNGDVTNNGGPAPAPGFAPPRARRQTEIPAVEDDPSIRPYGCNYCSLDLAAMAQGITPPAPVPAGPYAWRTIKELREHWGGCHKERGKEEGSEEPVVEGVEGSTTAGGGGGGGQREGLGEMPFRCALDPCGKTFKSLAGLRFHFQNASANGHFFVSLEVDQSTGEERPTKKFKSEVKPSGREMQCPIGRCPKKFKQSAGLAYHLSHTPNHPITLSLLSTFEPTLQSKTKWWFGRLGKEWAPEEGQ